IGQSAYAANNKQSALEAWPGREAACGPTLPPRSTTRLVERRAVEEIPRLEVKSGPESYRQAALTLFAVVAAEVFAARKMQRRRAQPHRRGVTGQRTSLAGILRHVDITRVRGFRARHPKVLIDE